MKLFWVKSPSKNTPSCLVMSPVISAAVLQELVPADQAVPVAVHACKHLFHGLQPRPPLGLGSHQVKDGVRHLREEQNCFS